MEKPESKRSMTNINLGLPPHMIQVIFSKLPIVNFPACRFVCRTWNDLILDYASSCKFVPNSFFLSTSDAIPYSNVIRYSNPRNYCNPKMKCIDIDTKHLELMNSVATFRFESDCCNVLISNSCNGLLFLMKYNPATFYIGILNPMTNEFMKLPGTEKVDHRYGFGFSLKTKRYKLVRLRLTPERTAGIFEIFTFGRNGTNQWSLIGSLPGVISGNGAYFNGFIYWIGRCKENDYVLYAFDVENEEFESIALPEVEPYWRPATIGAFNGSIYITFFMYPMGCRIKVWIMQSHIGKVSWIREFVIDHIPKTWVLKHRKTVYIHFIKVFEDGQILCHVNSSFFLLYNPKTGEKEVKKLNINAMAVSCIGPLESLNFGSLPNILSGDDEAFFYFI